jgi:hypothetical protein
MKTISGWYDTDILETVETLERVSNPHMLTPAGRAFAEGMCAAVRAEAQIDHYMRMKSDA